MAMNSMRTTLRLSHSYHRSLGAVQQPQWQCTKTASTASRYLSTPAANARSGVLAAQKRTTYRPAPTTPPGSWALVQQRCESNDAKANPPRKSVWMYDDILTHIHAPQSSTLLLDVREPHEHTDSTIPTSLNLPIVSHPDAFLLEAESFEREFGWQKPPINKEIVVFCKAGVRSRAAAVLAREAGYTNVAEYPGSMLDYLRRGGPTSKDPPAEKGAVEREAESTGPVTEMKVPRRKEDAGEEDLGTDGGVKYPEGPQGRQ